MFGICPAEAGNWTLTKFLFSIVQSKKIVFYSHKHTSNSVTFNCVCLVLVYTVCENVIFIVFGLTWTCTHKHTLKYFMGSWSQANFAYVQLANIQISPLTMLAINLNSCQYKKYVQHFIRNCSLVPIQCITLPTMKEAIFLVLSFIEPAV